MDVFFEIGFGTRMVSGAFSNFEIENWILKCKVIFSSFFIFFSKKSNHIEYRSFYIQNPISRRPCGVKKWYGTFLWDHFFILWENFQVLTDFDVFSPKKKEVFLSFSCKKADFFLQNPLNQIKNDRSRKINADGPREKKIWL